MLHHMSALLQKIKATNRFSVGGVLCAVFSYSARSKLHSRELWRNGIEVALSLAVFVCAHADNWATEHAHLSLLLLLCFAHLLLEIIVAFWIRRLCRFICFHNIFCEHFHFYIHILLSLSHSLFKPLWFCTLVEQMTAWYDFSILPSILWCFVSTLISTFYNHKVKRLITSIIFYYKSHKTRHKRLERKNHKISANKSYFQFFLTWH